MQFSKTRIAPTPSGFLHIGNVFSFAITVALAKKTGASVLLRIDDLDKARVRDEYVQDIFDSLYFLGIPWDEGPKDCQQYKSEYSQLYRLPLYESALQELKDAGVLFACNCPRSLLQEDGAMAYSGTCRTKNLPLNTETINWRIHTSQKELHIKNIYANASVASLPASMQDFVVRKKDGFPAYQLASVCDDMYFGIDLIVRGEDLFDSTIAQLYLASCFDDKKFGNTFFYHHALLMSTQHEKLSKSAGSISIQYLRKQGKIPAEIFAFIAEQLQIKGDVNDWQSLAAHVV